MPDVRPVAAAGALIADANTTASTHVSAPVTAITLPSIPCGLLLAPASIALPSRRLTGKRSVPDPVPRTCAPAGCAVVWIGELAAVQRKAAATDALRQADLE